MSTGYGSYGGGYGTGGGYGSSQLGAPQTGGWGMGSSSYQPGGNWTSQGQGYGGQMYQGQGGEQGWQEVSYNAIGGLSFLSGHRGVGGPRCA
jgi:hypothetical protein